MTDRPLRDALDEATSNSARFRLVAGALRGTFPTTNAVAVGAAYAADLFADFYESGLFNHAPAYVTDYRARLDLVVLALVEGVEAAEESTRVEPVNGGDR